MSGTILVGFIATGLVSSLGGAVLKKCGKFEIAEMLDFIAVASVASGVSATAVKFIIDISKVGAYIK